jgi:hypothetical protein
LASPSIIKNNDRSTTEQNEEKKKRLKGIADKHQVACINHGSKQTIVVNGQTAGAPLVEHSQ